MKLPRRTFLHLAAGAAALPVLPRIAWAQTYPSRPVRIIVGFPAGTSSDITARLIGQWLSDRLGQQFIVENRPGAGTNIATDAVVHAAPDGYTLLWVTQTNAINASVYTALNFNFIRDIQPVASIIRVAAVMMVHPSVPAKTVPEFIAYAKANPGKINMSSPGIGSANHVFGELFKMMTGVDLVHVPYRTSQFPDLLSGQVQVTFNPLPSSLEFIRAGKLRALAVTTAKRQDALPDVPTLGEFLPGYEADRVVRDRRAESDARRHCRQAQPRDRRWPRRCHAQRAAGRSRRRAVCRFAGRLRQVYRRGNREVGEGGAVRRHQAGVIPLTIGYSVTSVRRTPLYLRLPTSLHQLLSNLMPAVLIIGHHFSISALWYAASAIGFC
jgi:tripartite-type tricarboxylate transporter receptor subunit TctC